MTHLSKPPLVPRQVTIPKLGLTGRSQMLDVWDMLDADKRALLVEMGRLMIGPKGPRKL